MKAICISICIFIDLSPRILNTNIAFLVPQSFLKPNCSSLILNKSLFLTSHNNSLDDFCGMAHEANKTIVTTFKFFHLFWYHASSVDLITAIISLFIII